MVTIRSKQFKYKNSIKWKEERKGLLSHPGKPDIQIATPPEFKGHPGIWTPEDMFVASVNSCIMTTFLHYAERQALEFLDYESEAEGTLERVENKFMFSGVRVMPKVTVASSDKIEKTKALIELSEKNCLISNSIACKVEVHLDIKLKE